jgi:PAS domain S-box-containing protein
VFFSEPERARLLEITHDAIIVRTVDGTIRYWNRGAEEVYGWRADEAVGRRSHDLLATVPPAPIEEVQAQLLAARRWEGELRQQRRDGSTVVVESRWVLQDDDQGSPATVLELNTDITARRPFDGSVEALFGERGQVTGQTGAAVDISDVKRFEQQALDEQRRLRLALSASRLGVFELDLVTGRVVWSPECYRIFGTDTFAGTLDDVLARIHPADRDRVEAVMPAAAEGDEPLPVEFRIIKPDGEVRWVFNLTETYRNAAGQAAKQIGVVGDVTDRKRAELGLRALTAREREVLRLIAEGKSTKDIATTLTISPKTAETHRTNLMRKLDLHSVSGLVRYAVRCRLVEP